MITSMKHEQILNSAKYFVFQNTIKISVNERVIYLSIIFPVFYGKISTFYSSIVQKCKVDIWILINIYHFDMMHNS